MNHESPETGPCTRSWALPQLGPRRQPRAIDKRRATKRSKGRGLVKYESEESSQLQRAIKQHRPTCILCSLKRSKCSTNLANDHEVCHGCINSTKLTGIQLPCFKYNIMDAALFREHDAPWKDWTRRWASMKIKDIKGWESTEIKRVFITHGFGDAKFALTLRRFIPRPGDMLEHTWTDGEQTKRHQAIPYAISDMGSACKELKEYLDRCIEQIVVMKQYWLPAFVQDTFKFVDQYSHSAPVRSDRYILRCSLQLWAAVQMTSNVEWICGGDNVGQSVNDTSSPYHGTIPVPPVMCAQLEALTYSHILRPLRREVLSSLRELMTSNEVQNWFTAYLSIFVICHSCSLTTRRDEQFAQRMGYSSRFANGSQIAGHHHGILNLLAHFHFYCRRRDLCLHSYNEAGSDSDQGTSYLPQEAIRFLKRSMTSYTDVAATVESCRDAAKFGDHFYFLSQLFDRDWTPGVIASPNDKAPIEAKVSRNIGTVIKP